MDDVATWLVVYVRENAGVAGTVHVRRGETLELRAAHNIPASVIEAVQSIPKGKGMAGLAFERDESVTTCNLKTDRTGTVRPGARAVDANAAVALPVHDARGDVRAVVGIAFAGEREIEPIELERLAARAEELPV